MNVKDIQKEIAGIFAEERERLENVELKVTEKINEVYDLGYDDGWKAAFEKIREKFGQGRRE